MADEADRGIGVGVAVGRLRTVDDVGAAVEVRVGLVGVDRDLVHVEEAAVIGAVHVDRARGGAACRRSVLARLHTRWEEDQVEVGVVLDQAVGGGGGVDLGLQGGVADTRAEAAGGRAPVDVGRGEGVGHVDLRARVHQVLDVALGRTAGGLLVVLLRHAEHVRRGAAGGRHVGQVAVDDQLVRAREAVAARRPEDGRDGGLARGRRQPAHHRQAGVELERGRAAPARGVGQVRRHRGPARVGGVGARHQAAGRVDGRGDGRCRARPTGRCGSACAREGRHRHRDGDGQDRDLRQSPEHRPRTSPRRHVHRLPHTAAAAPYRRLQALAGLWVAPATDTLGGMCRPATCKTCGRPTWKGCGAHVEQVLGDVPPAERCQCRSTAPVHTRKSWFSR